MTLREKENQLFDEWSKGKKNFAKDGAGKNFEFQKIKLIFVGKETNKTDDKFDWREYLDNGVFYKKSNKPFSQFYNIYRWTKFLLDGPMDFKEYKIKERNKENRIDVFSRIAFMNIKKESGKSYSNTNEIIQKGLEEENQKYLSQQLDFYSNNNDIKILFLLGNGIYTPIKKIITDKYKLIKRKNLNKSRFIELYDNNLFVVKFYHFNRCGLNTGFDLIQKVYYFIKENTKKGKSN